MGQLKGAKATAEECGTEEFTIRRLGWRKKIPIYRAGRLVRFDPDEVRAYMKAQGEAMRVAPHPTRRNTKRSPSKCSTQSAESPDRLSSLNTTPGGERRLDAEDAARGAA
jgi:excisionase family DNA binding protein